MDSEASGSQQPSLGECSHKFLFSVSITKTTISVPIPWLDSRWGLGIYKTTNSRGVACHWGLARNINQPKYEKLSQILPVCRHLSRPSFLSRGVMFHPVLNVRNCGTGTTTPPGFVTKFSASGSLPHCTDSDLLDIQDSLTSSSCVGLQLDVLNFIVGRFRVQNDGFCVEFKCHYSSSSFLEVRK